jgi:hypothetical protein
VGLALITALMVFAFWNDIVRNWASIVGFVRSLGGGG